MVPWGHDLLDKYFRTSAINLDHTWCGDNLSYDKEPRMIRIMFHNVNGLPLQGPEAFDTFVNEQINLQVDIQGITEHCLDTTKFQVLHEVQTILRHQYHGQALMQLNSSNESALNTYKPGGTGIMMLGDSVGRLEPNGKGGDEMGRWSYVHIRRRHAPPVTIISAYQVCPRPTNILGNTAYHQQIRALHASARHNIHPRQAFIQDLSSFIATLTSQNHDIILGGDFNEALEDKKSGILTLLTRHNLTDVFLHRFPQHPPFGTHSFGKRRIDAVFVTPRMLPLIERFGYAPFHYTKGSDHRPILFEIDAATFFGSPPNPLRNIWSRNFTTKDKTAVTRFIETWYNEIQAQHGFSYVASINNDKVQPPTIEMLDDLIGKGSATAEQLCKRRRPEFYSQQIVQQRNRVSMLRSHLNGLRQGVDRTRQLQQRMHRQGLDIALPPTQSTTMSALRSARAELSKTCQENIAVRHAELESKIEAATQQGNKPRTKVLRAIKKFESTLQTHRILKAMKRKSSAAQTIDRVEIPASWPPVGTPILSINQLEDPKTCQTWRLISEPSEVEYYLLLRNRLHFGQAEGTPFTTNPLVDDLNWEASTTSAEDLLEGSYIIETVVPNCNDLLRACRRVTNLDRLPSELSCDDFKGKIKEN